MQSSRMAHHPRHHYRLAAALASAGYEVLTLAAPDPTSGHVDAVPVEYLPPRRSRLARMLSGPVTMWRVGSRRPLAVHVVCLDLLPWAVLLKKWGNCAVLYDSNEEYDTYMLIKEWLPQPARPVLQRLVRFLEPWLAAKLDAATTALPATQEKFVKAGVRSVLVRNFPPRSVVEMFEHAGPFEYDILLGGSLPPDQIPIVADTAARLFELGLRDARWLVAARGYGEMEKSLLEATLADRGVRECFVLRYNIPFTVMGELMVMSRVGFVPYPGDANYAARIPIRIFEYMAAGLPFVAADLPTIAQFVRGHDVAVLARAGDSDAYAHALAELLRDGERWKRMSEAGRVLVEHDYNWERESERLTALYSDVLDGRRS